MAAGQKEPGKTQLQAALQMNKLRQPTRNKPDKRWRSRISPRHLYNRPIVHGWIQRDESKASRAEIICVNSCLHPPLNARPDGLFHMFVAKSSVQRKTTTTVNVRYPAFVLLEVPEGRHDVANRGLSGRVKSGQRWSGQNRPTDVARDMVLLSHLLLIRQVRFRSPAPWSAFQDVTVV